ncbi:MAG TPA: M3 family metallopeptidase, partial [Fusibacter sp.]|nr:M3 family metallopeptidase [Fusibacter sp.]
MDNQVGKRMLRSEVPTPMTWNLKDLFESREIWKERLLLNEEDFNALSVYKGRLCDTASNLYDCLTKLEKAYINMVQLGTYASLRQSEDATNPQSQEDSLFYGAVATRSQSTISFISSEITRLDQSEYDALFHAYPDLKIYKNYLDDVYMQKPHKLSPDTEVALASLGEVMSAPYRIYQVSKAADMVFENFCTESEASLENSFALFESKYEFSPDTQTRRQAYDSFSKALYQYRNTYAAVYATEVKKQVAMSNLRNYSSVTEMLLEPQKVSLDMYNRQIDIIIEKLAPHMRKFATLKKEKLGLDALHFCDLKAPLD